MEDGSKIPIDAPAMDQLPAGPGQWSFMLRRRDKAYVFDRVKGRIQEIDADLLMCDFYGRHPVVEWSPIVVTYTEGDHKPVVVGRAQRDNISELLDFRNADHTISEKLDPKTLCE